MFLSVRDTGSEPAIEGSQPAIELDGSAGQTVRENSHRHNAVPDSDVYFVEFLDFECEGCRAAYPATEQLRTEYGDRVNFVLRYFPLCSHFNAEPAQKGQLEAMLRNTAALQMTDWAVFLRAYVDYAHVGGRGSQR